jgi:hypothetical protein
MDAKLLVQTLMLLAYIYEHPGMFDGCFLRCVDESSNAIADGNPQKMIELDKGKFMPAEEFVAGTLQILMGLE